MESYEVEVGGKVYPGAFYLSFHDSFLKDSS